MADVFRPGGLLGAIAGFTIFLGLPFGRLRQPSPRLRAGLNGVAIGILIFLVWDILSHAWEPTDVALADHDWGTAAAGLATLAVGLAVLGLLGLTYVDARIAARRARTFQPAWPAPLPRLSRLAGVVVRTRPVVDPETAGMQLALMIATGIGLHNFAEGLAIGSSAASGDIALALLLVIGFGVHNATEGFGIVAPLTGSPPRLVGPARPARRDRRRTHLRRNRDRPAVRRRAAIRRLPRTRGRLRPLRSDRVARHRPPGPRPRT